MNEYGKALVFKIRNFPLHAENKYRVEGNTHMQNDELYFRDTAYVQ